MADNQNQAADNAPNVADQVAAAIQMMQQAFQQQQAAAAQQMQQQQADAMQQIQQQLQADLAQQFAALNLAPPAPGPAQSMLKKVWQYWICLQFGGGGAMTSL